MINKKIEKEEKEYLKQTIVLIKSTIEDNNKKNEEYEKENNEMKEYIWENIKQMDRGEMLFYNQLFNVNNSISKMNRLKNEVLKEMENSPYFGRIDFSENKEKQDFKIYIGISNVMDENLNIQVYDWRCPISSLYYSAEKGACSYVAPEGEIKGNLTLKRQYKINAGELIYCVDSSIAISDEYLLEILNGNSSEKMSQIVSTIQQEQDMVIRNFTDKVLLVEGPAGCGKTSVALHHIAFLLYKNRNNLNSENILIFSPNELFSEYISDVLPSLGERNILQTEFSKFTKTYLSEFKNIETYDKYLERISDLNETELKKISVKMDKKIMDHIKCYADELIEKVVWEDIIIEGDLIFTGKQCKELMYKKFAAWPLMKKISKTIDYILMKIKHLANKKIDKFFVEEYLRSRVHYTNDFYQIAVDMYRDDGFRNKIFSAFNVEFEDNSSNFHKKINYEDAIILLYFRGLLYGFGYDNSIKQIVIDEAQDYTYIQMYILKEIFKEAFFTILGDQNQKLNQVSKDTFDDIEKLFDEYNPKRVQLKTTYRSSCEITDFCNKILNLTNVNPVKRKGDEPQVFKFEKKEERLSFLKNYLQEELAKEFNKIAIIVKNRNDEKLVKRNMKNIVDKRVVVLPVYVAKGLEFDSVIVYGEGFRGKSYYVACTRALHRLIVLV